jgi:DNA ligase-1
MKEIARAIYEIQAAPGRNDKLALLEKYAELPGFKDVLQFIYNPYIRTGIADNKLIKGEHSMCNASITVQDAIKYFEKNQTGSDNDVHFAWLFINAQDTAEAKNLAIAMVTKNLKIGISDKSLNKVYGDNFIPRIGCMLGVPYPENKHKVKGPFIATEKLDGIRRVLVKENGKSRMYSRSGIEDEGLVEIIEQASYLPDNTVYDGELLAMGTYRNSIALRQATNSIANRNGIRTGVTFNIFDIIPLDEFKKGKSKYNVLNRKLLLGAMFGDDGIQHLHDDWAKMMVAFDIGAQGLTAIKAVPILGVVNTEEEIAELVAPIWKRGGEGIMLNTFEGYYELKRSNSLLKVKYVESMDLKVVDMLEGTNKYKGMMGALVVDYKGYRVGVGSGFSDEERQRFWDNPEEIIGKTIEVDTFGESKDRLGNVSLNCAIFKGVRYDKK